MGGRALANVALRRYESNELIAASTIIQQTLSQAFGPDTIAGIRMPVWYRSKETHGDLDLLLFVHNEKGFNAGLREFLHERFGASEVVRNGSVWSFNYHDLQVDLNICDPADIDIAPIWYSYNDLSILLGRVFRYWHLKWAPDGLWIEVFGKDRSVKITELLISKDPRQIFEWMGYSWERYLEGFDTVDDVYSFVVSSPKFARECCDRRHLNNDTRLRDNKRPNVVAFDAWLEQHNVTHTFGRPSLADVMAMFTNDWGVDTAARIDEAVARHEIKARAAEKFNGRHVIEEFGLQGRLIGAAIDCWKGSHGDTGENRIVEQFILDHPYPEIVADFRARVFGDRSPEAWARMWSLENARPA